MATERGGRNVLIIVVVLVALVGIAYALGLFNVDTSGDVKTPSIEASVDVEGGELPDVQVETADVDVGTTTETVKVPDVDVKTEEAEIKLPDVDVTPAGDDSSAKQ